MKKWSVILILIAAVSGCYYDNEERLYPDLNSNCDTTGITWSGTIRPILQTNCLSCHSSAENAANGGNIDLESFASVKTRVEQGSLLGAMRHESPWSPMPKGGNKLDDCSITKVRIWIENGAKE